MGRPHVEAKRARRRAAQRAKHKARRRAKLERRLAGVELEHRAAAAGLELPTRQELAELGPLR